MFRLRLALCPLVWWCCLTFSFAEGSDLDPSEVYLHGYQVLQKAQAAESKQKLREALDLYRESSAIFDSIVKDNPAWRIDMVSYRRKKVRSEIQRLAAIIPPEDVPPASSLPDLPQRDVQTRIYPTAPGRPSGTVRVDSPSARFQQLERDVKRLRDERTNLFNQLQAKTADSAEARRALANSQSEVDQLRQRLEQMQGDLSRLKETGRDALLSQVEELKSQLTQATEALKTANGRTAVLLLDLEKANNLIADLRLQTEALTQERDEMAAIIKGLSTDESTGQLVKENISLREQLNSTRARLDTLEIENAEGKQEILNLRQEVADLRSELARVQAENDAYKQRLGELSTSLESTDRELTFNPPSVTNTAAREENNLLREIIERQLKREAFRQEQKELVIQELKETESGSEQLLARIEEIAKDLPLTDREKAALSADGLSAGELGGAASSQMDTEPKDLLSKALRRYADAAAYNFEQGRFEQAELNYREALQFAPGDVGMVCNLGVTQIRLNKLDEARGLLEKALLVDPSHGRGNFILGIVDYYLDDLEGAVTSITKAVELVPQNAEYHHFLGVVQFKRGDFAAAEAALTTAVELKRYFPMAHRNLAAACLSQEPPKILLAQQHYHEAVSQGFPADAEMDRQLGVTPKGPQAPVENSPAENAPSGGDEPKAAETQAASS